MIAGKRHALVWGPFFLLLVAFVLHVHQLYMMFATLGLLVPVSFILGRRKLSGLSVTRHGQSVMTAGERGIVTMAVINDGKLRQSFFSVTDHLPDGLESPEGGVVLVADLLPEQELRLTYSLLARRRGAYMVGPPMFEGSDFLGLFRFRRRVGAKTELLVYPRAMKIPNLWQRAAQGRQPHKAVRRIIGPSSDLYGVREYVTGDDVRRIDWKSSARRRKLHVIETEQIETTEAIVLLDLNKTGHFGSHDAGSIEYATTLAASLLAEALSRGCMVGLIAHGSRDYSVPAIPTPRQQILLLEALARLQADGEHGLLETLQLHKQKLPPGSSVAVISTVTGPEAYEVASWLQTMQHPTSWFALSADSFDVSTSSMESPEYQALLGGLVQRGMHVIPVYGHLPLENSLWRRERVARRG